MKFAAILLFACPAFTQSFDSSAHSTVMVAMRDGVKLATDVYRPARHGAAVEGKFPVLVTRSPYNKNGERTRGEQFARHGYVFVAQDVRGRYASEGRLSPLLQEGEDGYDTIAWAVAQPWSNGKAGTTGASYLAMDQFSAAALRPPGLTAMYAAVGTMDYYHSAAWKGGVQSTGWPVWLAFSASTSRYAKDHPDIGGKLDALVKDPSNWLRLPVKQRQEVFRDFPDQLQAYRDYLEHPEFDAYWRQLGYYPAARIAEMPDVPILFLTGWYDQFLDSTMDAFKAMSRWQKTPKRLIIGPWPHGYGKSQCGAADFGPGAELKEFEVQRQWFDRWMKGTTAQEPVVRYFRMGGGQKSAAKAVLAPGGAWLTSAQWPPQNTSTLTLHLASSGRLGPALPERTEPTTYSYDPTNPAPPSGRYGPQCIQDQRTQRSDIVAFTSETLAKAVDVTGNVVLNLWASSTARNADFIVKLVDVYPGGFAMNLAEGRIRTPDSLAPGAVYSLPVDMGATSNLFAPGHKIQVTITSSSFPQLELNPNAGTVSIYHDPVHPSSLTLTVLPARD
jgi:putative CocE/NonD family hydrolase